MKSEITNKENITQNEIHSCGNHCGHDHDQSANDCAEKVRGETFLEGLKDSTILIWGFGKTGKSFLNFLLNHAQPKKIIIADKKVINKTEHNISESCDVILEQDIDFDAVDFILPSPGIILPTSNEKIHGKVLPEIEIFFHMWTGKIIAITGSVGKTSTATIAYNALIQSYDKDFVFLAGNIGSPMLDLLNPKNNFEDSLVVLELSSAQLQYSSMFIPALTVWTNFYPNHLDYHKDIEEYNLAKKSIVFNRINYLMSNEVNSSEKERDEAWNFFHEYIPKDIILGYSAFASMRPPLSNETAYTMWLSIMQLLKFHVICSTQEEYNNFLNFPDEMEAVESITWIEKNEIHIKYNTQEFSNLSFKESFLPHISYIENILCVFHILLQIGAPLSDILSVFNAISQKNILPEHRFELILPEHKKLLKQQYNIAAIINDSKATVIESTESAIKRCKNEYGNSVNLITVIGGLSKGVDRKDKIVECSKLSNTIIFFGTEKDTLYDYCTEKNTSCTYKKIEHFDELLTIMPTLTKQSNKPSVILFSPGGASFDMFKNYEDRGTQFKIKCQNGLVQ